MNQIDLCAGINGFGLAGRWMGWKSVATCEIDPFCQRVLKKNFPNAYHHSDLFTLTADILEKEITNRFGPDWRNPGVILTAGLPCQPFSVAGDRRGQNDPRFLWPTAIGLVRELRPDVCVFENVAGLLSILEPDSVSEMERETFELFDENDGKSRKVIERVERRVIGRIIADLEQAGYILPQSADGTPIVFCIPACAVEAIHQRDRVWIVAYAASGSGRGAGRVQRPGTLRKAGKVGQAEKFAVGCNAYATRSNAHGKREQQPQGLFDKIGRRAEYSDQRLHANTSGARLEKHNLSAFTSEQGFSAGGFDTDDSNPGSGRRQNGRQVDWQPNDTSEILRIAYGVPGGVDGRARNRKARVKAMGNAIVWQVAYAIFQAIEAFLKNNPMEFGGQK